jgi:hypothetical protein
MDIQEIIKNRYKELPADIQQAITNTDLAGKFEKIAQKHSLHIDQNGALQTETILVMLGLEPTEDYVNNVQSNLEVSREEANAIAQDINTEILDSIRSSLRTLQEQQESKEPINNLNQNRTPQTHTHIPVEQTVSAIEKAGQFVVEKEEEPAPFPKPIDDNLGRDELLKHLEDQNIPIIDHLLTTQVSSPAQVETKKITEKNINTVDPYREQI